MTFKVGDLVRLSSGFAFIHPDNVKRFKNRTPGTVISTASLSATILWPEDNMVWDYSFERLERYPNGLERILEIAFDE